MASNKIFSTVPLDQVRRSRFDMSHSHKTTTQMGRVTPILLKEVVPGDSVRLSTEGFIRAAPLVSPVYHEINSFIWHFFVPTRILVQGHGEDNIWQKFITGGQYGDDAPMLPYFTLDDLFHGAVNEPFTTDAQYLAGVGPSSIWSYLGLPSPVVVGYPDLASTINITNEQHISLLPFAAMMRIMIDYFLDENYLSAELETSGVPLHEGQYLMATAADKQFIKNWVLGMKVAATEIDGTYRVGYEKDYLTSALPFTQRGGDVLIPMEAEVNYADISTIVDSATDLPLANQNMLLGNNAAGVFPSPTGQTVSKTIVTDNAGPYVRVENIDDITNSTITINDLRTAIVVQRWLENNARAGFKYNEQIKSHFGVEVPDYRLDRSEYLGGGRSHFQIGEVLATATSEDAASQTLPQGNMAGRAISYQESNAFTYQCKEHGYIISIYVSIPRTGYFQGLDKMWTRADKFDYLQPEFANLGEQEVSSNEVYWDLANGDTTFGYQQRYAEYKYAADRITGDFTETLLHWTLTRVFSAAVAENSLDFITVDPAEQTRIFAVQTGDNLWAHFRHNLSMIRPLPYYSVPGLNKI